jgi:hypothetical protein
VRRLGLVRWRNLITAGHTLCSDLWIDAGSATALLLDDGVRPTRLLPDLHMLPGLWKIDGSGTIQFFEMGPVLGPFSQDGVGPASGCVRCNKIQGLCKSYVAQVKR